MNHYTNPWMDYPLNVLLKYLVGVVVGTGPRLLNLGDLAELPPCPKTLSFFLSFFETLSLCCADEAPCNSQGSSCLCSPGFGIKGVHCCTCSMLWTF